MCPICLLSQRNILPAAGECREQIEGLSVNNATWCTAGFFFSFLFLRSSLDLPPVISAPPPPPASSPSWPLWLFHLLAPCLRQVRWEAERHQVFKSKEKNITAGSTFLHKARHVLQPEIPSTSQPKNNGGFSVGLRMLLGARGCWQWRGCCPHTEHAKEEAAGSRLWRQVLLKHSSQGAGAWGVFVLSCSKQ